MKWLEAKISFEADDPDAAISLISDFFLDIGQQGVTIESPEQEPGVDWADDAFPVSDQYAVIGYIPENQYLAERCRLLEEKLSALKIHHNVTWHVSYRDIDEQDWAESWKAYFFPVKVSDKIVIKPTWREYDADSDDIIIEIDPGMAFGTGTHPTTAMCIKMIEKFIHPDDSFLDVGTGSGILMLAAEKLGASRLVGIDADEVAVSVAIENLKKNQVPFGKFEVLAGNLVNGLTGRFNLITANIVAEVIIRLIGDIRPFIAENGILICSGIITKKREMVEQELMAKGFDVVEVLTRDEWVAVAAQLKTGGIESGS